MATWNLPAAAPLSSARRDAAARRGLDSGSGDKTFYQTKLDLADFYAKRELSGSNALRKKVEAGAETVMRVPEEAF